MGTEGDKDKAAARNKGGGLVFVWGKAAASVWIRKTGSLAALDCFRMDTERPEASPLPYPYGSKAL